MTTEAIQARAPPRGLLATPSYVRLWFAGGVGNAMRWVELLVAGIFTFDVTHSAFLVAVVVVARSLPMLFLGPLCGGAVYEVCGLGGAYLMAAALYVVAILAVAGLDFRQEPRRLRFGRIAGDIAEGLAVARATPAIFAVVLVTIIMNSFGF